MKNFLKNIAYFVLSLFEYKGAVVLMYHSIGDNKEFFTVSKDEFERQMQYLSTRKFNVIDLKRLVGLLNNKSSIPTKTIVITFDDGYQDNFLNAFPVLKKYNFPATIFVSTANIGKSVKARKGSELKMASTAQLEIMLKSGIISVGSHSDEHKKLAGLTGEQTKHQLLSSKEKIRSMLGDDATFLAYPSGSVSDEVKRISSKHFVAALGVQKGRVLSGENLMEINRNSIDSEVTFAQFRGIVKFGRL